MNKKFEQGDAVFATIIGKIYGGDDFNGYEIEYLNEEKETCYAVVSADLIHIFGY